MIVNFSIFTGRKIKFVGAIFIEDFFSYFRLELCLSWITALETDADYKHRAVTHKSHSTTATAVVLQSLIYSQNDRIV